MFTVRSSWLFFLIKFLIICVGGGMAIDRVPGYRLIRGNWNPEKFSSEDLPYGNLAENEILNRVGFADYGSVIRQHESSADFVFPDEVFVPPVVPERPNEIFPAQDGVPIRNVDKYLNKILRKEEKPEYVDRSINLAPKFIPDIDSRLFQMPSRSCPEGHRIDIRGICKIDISRK